jgi:phage baseplate assembly protein W
MVQHEEDIRQSLDILFSTIIRERVMRPDYGCNLEEYVFNPLTVSRISYLEELIKRSIALHEPRIKFQRMEVLTSQLEGEMKILIEYLVRSTNTRSNWVYPFYKQEGTNVEL